MDEVVFLGVPPRKRNIFTCHAFIFPFSMSENVCHLWQDAVCGVYWHLSRALLGNWCD